MENGSTYRVRNHGLILVLFALVFVFSSLFAPLAYADECPAGGYHDFRIDIITPVTSTTEGLSLYTCKKCGYQEYVNVESTGHEWSDWYTIQEPTCTSEGIEERVCAKQSEHIHYEQRIIPMLSTTGEHNFVETEHVDPTCTEDGRITYTCSICGYSYTDIFLATGHEWGPWIVDVEPTATEEAGSFVLHDGSAHRVCANDPSHQETQVLPASAEGLELSSPEPENDDAVVSEEQIEDDPKPKLFADDFFTAAPGHFDRAVLVIDIAVIVVVCVSSLSLFYSYLWIRQRREKALQQATEHLAKNSGASTKRTK